MVVGAAIERELPDTSRAHEFGGCAMVQSFRVTLQDGVAGRCWLPTAEAMEVPALRPPVGRRRPRRARRGRRRGSPARRARGARRAASHLRRAVNLAVAVRAALVQGLSVVLVAVVLGTSLPDSFFA